MKQILLAFCLAQTLLLAACANCFPGKNGGIPPTEHNPLKADLFRCTDSKCELIPVNIQVKDNLCTVPFLFERVEIQGGKTAHFTLAALTPEYKFRFTDPTNDVSTEDPAKRRPGIEIDEGGLVAVFSARYSDRPTESTRTQRAGSVNPGQYAVTAISGQSNKDRFYQFRIHAEWSVDGGKWFGCVEEDPVIANS